MLCMALLAALPASTARVAQIRMRLWSAKPQEITRPGASVAETFDLTGALAALKIPSVSIAIIDHAGIPWAAPAVSTPVHTGDARLFQAASLAKLVTAVAALRLVQDGRLNLDQDVNAELTEWHVPPSEMTGSSPDAHRETCST